MLDACSLSHYIVYYFSIGASKINGKFWQKKVTATLDAFK